MLSEVDTTRPAPAETDSPVQSSSPRRKRRGSQTKGAQDGFPVESGPIYFYEKYKPHYGFTNFAPHEVVFEGNVYPTSEHLFQAFKFLPDNPLLAEHIRTSGSQPRMAFDQAHRFASEVRKDWRDVNILVMDQILHFKFEQHADLKEELLSTGEAELIENAGAKDAFWGNGADGKGRNELGKALMRLRSDLRSNARL
ncbi:hypothetical protein FRB96_001090 [Tulasnella sp. 330]|nr:hypothetical protein FRB96_001090 [Tulasnella sp. 330]